MFVFIFIFLYDKIQEMINSLIFGKEEKNMELKKCERCGCFHVSESSVCQGCVKKDSADMLKLKVFLESAQENIKDKDELAMQAGISIKNIDRYLNMEEFSNIEFNSIKTIKDESEKIIELL